MNRSNVSEAMTFNPARTKDEWLEKDQFYSPFYEKNDPVGPNLLSPVSIKKIACVVQK